MTLAYTFYFHDVITVHFDTLLIFGPSQNTNVHVIHRHNLIMETPEARAKSAELHKKLLEEEKLKNPSVDGDEEEDEEGEVDENEDLSSGEEEIHVC